MHIQPMPSAPAPTVSTHARAGPHRRSGSRPGPARARRRDAAPARRRRRTCASTLGDRSGQVVAIVWEDVEALLERCVAPGARCASRGRYERHPRYGPQVVVRALSEPLPGSFDLADLVDGPPRSAQPDGGRPARARRHDPATRISARCSTAILGEHTEQLAPLPRRAGGQALPPGLRPRPARALALGRAGACTAIAAHFPGHRPRRRRDRRAAARHRQARGLHGRRRLDRPHRRRPPAGRDPARLLPHPRARSRTSPGFPPDTAQAVLHIILSHHGSLDHGSPVVPCTREATLVHHIDNLGGRLGSFDRLEKELAPGQSWTLVRPRRSARARTSAPRSRPSAGRRSTHRPAAFRSPSRSQGCLVRR